METVETSIFLLEHPSEVAESFELSEEGGMQTRNKHFFLSVALLNLFHHLLKVLHGLIVNILHVPEAKDQETVEVIKWSFLLGSLPTDD